MKITVLALFMAAAPSLALAMGCGSGHEKVTMSCADGANWDSDKQICIPVVSS